ncbi:MAG TPA: hypothetical protein VFE58_13125 [Tepidisphaeraceae bacterium]|jgi:hypothetical protein|nr:hypothetical protein [Tepidisphaeraceae bacterium]
MPTLQELCQLGQSLLVDTDYIAAEQALVQAEHLAVASQDYDTLARLYMPLQESRRQRRQRCGEGTIVLDLLAESPTDLLSARHIVENFSHGQLLVAGWASIEPALALRQLISHHNLYLETFLAAVYPIIGGARAVAIIPTTDVALPSADERSIDELLRLLPPHSILLPAATLPVGPRKGTAATYAEVMSLWEQLHLPYLATADQTPDPLQRIAAYRKTIQVDYACELAHQKLSNTAHELAKATKTNPT